MASGSKIRTLARHLDAAGAVLWVIGPRGRLVYVSAGAARWLEIEADSLIDRRAIASAPASDEPLDRLAASLSPPPGLTERGLMSARIAPVTAAGTELEPMAMRFLRIGVSSDVLTIALAGDFDESPLPAELVDAVAVRSQLEAYRKCQAAVAGIVTAGSSSHARRTRARIQVAAAARSHVGFFAPRGSGAETIAARIHQLSAPQEPIVTVEGPLMDAELLDATLTPLINQLADDTHAQGTALVRGLDETAAEAQARLAELLTSFPGRLRLLAICGEQPPVLREPLSGEESLLNEIPEPSGLSDRLIDVLSTLTVRLWPLTARVEDIPIVAAALVDARHAAGDGVAERLSRQALDALVTYPWPGDFDELDAAIRHAMRTTIQVAIGVEQLPLAIRSYRSASEQRSTSTPLLTLDEALQRYEQRLIDEAVQAADGNRAEAARRLGISRGKLLRRLRRNTGGE